jgi:hypothetical protein
MISNLYVHTLSVEPLTQSATKKQTYGTAFDIRCFVQALDTEDALQADGVFQFFYKGYCDINEVIKEGDRASFDGEVFIIKSIARYRIPNRGIAHLRFILAKVKD